MRRLLWLVLAALTAALAVALPAAACSICNMNLQQTKTMRQDAEEARLVLFGTLDNPRLTGTSGATDLRIEAVLKNDPFLGNTKVIEIPKYLPILDPKNPPRFVLFCDVYNNKLDPYRGVPLKSDASLEYLKGALALDGKDRTACLLYFFRYLENPDKEVASDAFLEFAKANDQEIGSVAGKLSAEKLRGWIKDPQTPAYR